MSPCIQDIEYHLCWNLLLWMTCLRQSKIKHQTIKGRVSRKRLYRWRVISRNPSGSRSSLNNATSHSTRLRLGNAFPKKGTLPLAQPLSPLHKSFVAIAMDFAVFLLPNIWTRSVKCYLRGEARSEIFLVIRSPVNRKLTNGAENESEYTTICLF